MDCRRPIISRAKRMVSFQNPPLNLHNQSILNTCVIQPGGKQLLCTRYFSLGGFMSERVEQDEQNIFSLPKKKNQLNKPPCNFLIEVYYLHSNICMNFAQLFALIRVTIGNYHSNHGMIQHSCTIIEYIGLALSLFPADTRVLTLLACFVPFNLLIQTNTSQVEYLAHSWVLH